VDNLKPFDPNDVDETLTRVVTHRGITYVLFPYVNATGEEPRFNSLQCAIEGPAATIDDFAALAQLITQRRSEGKWFISFNTPWLMTAADREKIAQRAAVPRPKRS